MGWTPTSKRYTVAAPEELDVRPIRRKFSTNQVRAVNDGQAVLVFEAPTLSIRFEFRLFSQSMESINERDWREVVGFPRKPLPKLSSADRKTVKKRIETASSELDPAVGIRMALCSGVPIRPEWLTAGLIDLALETDDITRNFEKLATVAKSLDAAQASEALSKRLDKAPKAALRALHKLAIQKIDPKRVRPRVEVTKATALWFTNIATLLVPILLRGVDARDKRKNLAYELIQVVNSVLQQCQVTEVAVRALEFLRILEKELGWEELEKEYLQTMRLEILKTPAKIINNLLNQGCIEQADTLSQCVTHFPTASEHFKRAVEQLFTANRQLPLASKGWAHRLLTLSDNEIGSLTDGEGNAAQERLALVLISLWEARTDGKVAAHAFELSEEVFRIGFNLFLQGQVGSHITFDPDIHENYSSSNQNRKILSRGDEVELVRPWIEHRSKSGVSILMKGRVVEIAT